MLKISTVEKWNNLKFLFMLLLIHSTEGGDLQILIFLNIKHFVL